MIFAVCPRVADAQAPQGGIAAEAANSSEALNGTPATGRAPSADSIVHFGKDNQPEFVDSSRDIPARTVFIEMQGVAAASKYDVQVRPYGQNWAGAYKLSTNEPQLRLRLTPGHYSIRTRSLDGSNRKGTWGRWKEFWVNFKPPSKVIPADGTVIPPMGNNEEKITFEWPQIELAKFYLFVLRDQSGRVLQRVVTPQTWFVARVAVKRSYTWSVTPLSSKEDAAKTDLEFVWHNFEVDQPNETLRSVFFQIAEQRKVKMYQFEFVKFTGENLTTEPSVYDSYTPDVRIRLGPGKYEVRARNVYVDGSKSDWNAPQTFYVEIPPPTLVAPKNNEMLDPTDHEHSKVLFKWRKVREAERYQLTVFRDSDGKIMLNEFVKDSSYLAGLPHETKYHWQVIAYNPGEKDKGPGSDRYPAQEGGKPMALPSQVFSIDTYIKLELSNSEEPSQLYAWASHRSSMIGYVANNYDNGTALRDNVFGGTGEIAIGYWHRKTDYGFLGIADLSGFTIESQTYMYNSASLLFGKRYKLGGNKRLRWWGGVTYHETPEIISDLLVTQISFAKIAGYGPEGRISYMFDVTKSIGGHVFGQLTYVPFILETPNGQPAVSPIAYGVGIQGTKRLENGWVGMLGYSYQGEQAGYGSFDRTGNPNAIYWAGHFLTLSLQFGLEESYR
jgi:hypothetical protein